MIFLGTVNETCAVCGCSLNGRSVTRTKEGIVCAGEGVAICVSNVKARRKVREFPSISFSDALHAMFAPVK